MGLGSRSFATDYSSVPRPRGGEGSTDDAPFTQANRPRLPNDVEGSVPASLVEDMEEDVAHKGQAVADGLLVDLVGGSFKGPVDEHGAADDVFARDESPEAAVERLGAIVAHGKHRAVGDDEFAILDVVGQVVGPQRSIVKAGLLL